MDLNGFVIVDEFVEKKMILNHRVTEFKSYTEFLFASQILIEILMTRIEWI
jgi:hypothetical protein